MVRIEAIYSFPIKSCAPIALSTALIRRLGLPHDRTFMVVDSEGKFITQRKYPVMSQIVPKMNSDNLILTYSDNSLVIDLDTSRESVDVTVWKSRVRAGRVSEKADAWLSSLLGEEVTLVRYIRQTHRSKFLRAPFNDTVDLTFSDGYPIHIINQSSVDDLGSAMGHRIDPLRFRPNLIISGLGPYEEESLDTIEGDDFKLRVVKPTGRCKIPNIDPVSGEYDLNVLGQLSTYKKSDSKVNFGIYAYPLTSGEASIGESLSICYK